MLITYILIGVLWSLYWELNIEMTWGRRIRTLFLWPVTVVAWCVGFIQAMIENDNE
jgi:hypothetical protein